MLFTKKCDANWTLVRFIAWLEAQGFQRIPDIDYHESLSPIFKITSLRLMLAILEYLNSPCRYWNSISSWRFRRNYLHGTTQNDGKWQVSWLCMQATQVLAQCQLDTVLLWTKPTCTKEKIRIIHHIRSNVDDLPITGTSEKVMQ